MDHNREYNKWLLKHDLDERVKADLIAIRSDDDEIFSRFYTYLNFGTGGLRGLMGAGTNRMNIYTIRQDLFSKNKVLQWMKN